ncbi:Proline iminopeptidase [Cytospora mali]|uniref:Proline iminopeptidase n=1 Tax=Cytospora mali TaxID=578113 RepID=A0A194VPK6_CYTMA|nr:Proline iminopeptidase [Valsa mali]
MTLEIPKAILKSYVRHVVPGALLVTEYLFSVPLDYRNPNGAKIQLFAKAATKHEVPINPQQTQYQSTLNRPWFVFLQGGPGFGNPEPQDSSLTRFVLNRGYQILFLDYRGVGLSTTVTADTIPKPGASPKAQAEYLKLFRQVDNVRDLEAVRKCLTEHLDDNKAKWSIFGQSFGGFVCLSYLSQHPEGLSEVFMTGGLAPISKTPEEVYTATFQKVFERSTAYYKKFPEDVAAVRRVTAYLHAQGPKKGVQLPGGGMFTARRLLTLGHMFGMHGGLDSVHSVVLRMAMDLDQYGFLTRPTLTQVESYLPFDSAPIYAVLHEAIYCYKKGVASNWAAQRVGEKLENFRWLDPEYSAFDSTNTPLYFSGEMVFPFMFDDYPELQKMREAAEILAKYTEWDDLYDEDKLKTNQVPVYAASYIEDMYVDFGLARETARKVNLIRVLETNTMYHNAIRARADEVLPQLFKLRDDVID